KKGLAIVYANHLAVVTGELIHFVLQTVNGEEDFALAGCPFELRMERFDGFVALGKLGSDVDDKGWTSVGEGRRIEYFVRAERYAGDGKLLEAGQKAAFVAQSRRVVMVWMAGLPVRNDDGTRAEFTNDGREAKLVLSSGLDV